MYEVEAKLLKEVKKKNNYEEYNEFNAEDQLQQLINFTADKVVGRVEAQAEWKAHAEAEAQLKVQKGKDKHLEKKCFNQRTAWTGKKSWRGETGENKTGNFSK